MKYRLLSLITILGFSICVSAQIPSYIPKDSLVGWWPFNGNAIDESGKGNNGIVQGAILDNDRYGISNKSYSFDGIGDFIDCGSSKSLNITGSISVSMWIYANNFSSEHGLMSNYSNGGGFDLMTSADNTIPPLDKLRWMDQGGFLFTKSISSKKWYHLVAVFNAVNGEKIIYLDGKSFAKKTSTINKLKSSDINLFIGSHQAAIVNYWSWDGNIDDVGIWNRALDSNEIKSMYSGSTANVQNDNSNSTIKVYPNPAKDRLVIDLGNSPSVAGYEINIFDVTGKSVYNSTISKSYETIDLNTWSGKGIYFIRIFDKQGNRIENKKIIIQ